MNRSRCLTQVALATALVLGLVLGGAACRVEPGSAEPTPHPPSVEVDPNSDVGATDADARAAAQAQARRAEKAKQVDASARRIILEVARARGLPVSGEFSVELIDKPGVRAFVQEVMREEMSLGEMQTIGRVESALGVIPVGRDGEEVMLELLEFGVLGIYDPKRKTLLIGDYVDRMSLGMVVGHEGAHGLQDMHFDLEALNQMHRGRSDLDTAKTWLIEGDAQASYLAWMTGDEGLVSIGDDLLDRQADQVLLLGDGMGIPYPTLARMLQMPYTDGTRTIIRLARSQGWAAIDALYADLPTTSEQMLHPDKLATREPARAVTIDPSPLLALASGHQVSWEDELGEASLVAMLADVASPAKARAAASGWGGDRYVSLEHQTDPAAAPLVVGVIAWDSTADAKQFEPVFRAYLQKHKPDDHLLARKGDKLVYATHFRAALDRPAAGAGADDTGETPGEKALEKAAWAAFSVAKANKTRNKG